MSAASWLQLDAAVADAHHDNDSEIEIDESRSKIVSASTTIPARPSPSPSSSPRINGTTSLHSTNHDTAMRSNHATAKRRRDSPSDQPQGTQPATTATTSSSPSSHPPAQRRRLNRDAVSALSSTVAIPIPPNHPLANNDPLPSTSPPSSSLGLQTPTASPIIDSKQASDKDDEDEVDVVGLSRELGIDLTTTSTPSRPLGARLSQRSAFGDEMFAGDALDAKEGSSKEKKSARRYFDGEDLSFKCHNCGRVGHAAADCNNATVYKPCWICGLRGHPAHRCPREPCYRCAQTGHISKDCPNDRVSVKVCYWCGSTSHLHMECKAKQQVDLAAVRCYVCGTKGHLNCAANIVSTSTSPFASVSKLTRVSCSCCGLQGHSSAHCNEEKMELYVNVDNFGNVVGGTGVGSSRKPSRKSWLDDQECFYCGEKGHLKFDCPAKEKDEQRRSQFRNQYTGSAFGNRPGPNGRSHSATPFSREAARDRERRQSGGSSHSRNSDRHDSSRSHHRNSSSDRHDRDDDRDRDLMSRSYDRHHRDNDRRSSSGGSSSSHREGRSRTRDDHRSDNRSRNAKSQPPSSRHRH